MPVYRARDSAPRRTLALAKRFCNAAFFVARRAGDAGTKAAAVRRVLAGHCGQSAGMARPATACHGLPRVIGENVARAQAMTLRGALKAAGARASPTRG